MDYQETKAPLFEALAIARESLQVVSLYAASAQVNAERLRAACTNELFATDRAYALARDGIPFRDAYRQVAADPAGQEVGDLVARLHARDSEGAPGNLGLDQVAGRIAAERAAWQRRQTHVEHAIAALLRGDSAVEPDSRYGGSGGFADGCDIALGI
jgi:argininosuccinate lyase